MIVLSGRGRWKGYIHAGGVLDAAGDDFNDRPVRHINGAADGACRLLRLWGRHGGRVVKGRIGRVRLLGHCRRGSLYGIRPECDLRGGRPVTTDDDPIDARELADDFGTDDFI